MITEKQFERIKNIGIEPAKPGDVLSKFAKACYDETDVDLLIDASSAPSDLESRREWGLPASEWHEGVRQALARHASEYAPACATAEEFEAVMKLADDDQKHHFAEWLRGRISLEEVARRAAADRAKAA